MGFIAFLITLLVGVNVVCVVLEPHLIEWLCLGFSTGVWGYVVALRAYACHRWHATTQKAPVGRASKTWNRPL